MKLKATEKQTQRAVLDYLNYSGYFAWRNNSGFIILGKQKKRVIKIGLVGMPDILCIKKFKGLQILIGFEIKGEDGELNENQIIMKKNLEQYYVKYFVVRSVDDVVNSLKKYDKELLKLQK